MQIDMNFTFLCLVILQYSFICIVFASYNKDVVCVIDKDKQPVCKSVSRVQRRQSVIDKSLPSHEPYIPRKNTILYACSTLECKPFQLSSITQISSPDIQIKSCYVNKLEDYDCDDVKYHSFKNIDKLLFLKNSIPNKTFYMVDCLVYADGGRVCHKKDGDNVDSQAKLIDTGTIARPKEPYILALDEFICEEGPDKQIHCDLNPYVAFEDELKLKEGAKSNGEVFLKSGSYVALLTRNCVEKWCGFSGQIKVNRRRNNSESPGGKTYRCYYARKQQICKEVWTEHRNLYKDKNWLGS